MFIKRGDNEKITGLLDEEFLTDQQKKTIEKMARKLQEEEKLAPKEDQKS